MKDFFSRLKDYGVLVWFALSTVAAIAAICLYGYSRKKRGHLEQETRGETKGRLYT